MFKRFLLLTLFTACFLNGFAQFYPTQYRPAGLNWQQLTTQHFKVVFPAGEDSAAWRTARILESQYRSTKELTGGSLDNFPVVLTNYNDRSNGFVTPTHFRSEIDLHPIKGKSLNPQSGNWLEAVVPHELVHAQQLNNLGGFGVGSIVGLFSPDLGRSFHGAIPSGLTEGLATYHETVGVAPDGGRGNLPFFTNQFDAIFNSDSRWSMGQMSHFPERTRPFNRHYIGGYKFTHWLQQTYGEDVTRDALNYYIKLPFLGYGIALLHATGKWPAQLYDQFEADTREKLTNTGQNYSNASTTLDMPYKGSSVRRPLWLDENTILFYGSFYNKRSGFYRYDLKTDDVAIIDETSSVQDYIYDLSEDKNRLLFSYYKASTIYESVFSATLAELDISRKKITEKKTPGRLYAPKYDGDKILALDHHHDSNQLVSIQNNTKTVLAELGADRIIHADINPADTNQIAVVANKRGLQGLWLTNKSSIQEDLGQEPIIAFSDGSVYDPVWHPSGDKLLFTSDINQSMNIYEYDISTDRLFKLTNTRYNSYEAAYNADGSKIVFVQQVKNEAKPAVLERADFLNETIPRALWKSSKDKMAFMDRPELGKRDTLNISSWKQSDHSPGLSWLVPRTLLPVFEEVSNRNIYEYGIGFHSNSLLQDQAYSLDLTFVQNRLWYDLSYRNKQFFPGFRAEVFSRPFYSSIAATSPDGPVTFTFLTQRRGASLSIPIQLILENNVQFSSIFIEPEFRYSQLRYFELAHSGDAASNFADFSIANVFSSFSYKLQQNIRDIQPNSGIQLYSELEYYLSSEPLYLQTPQLSGQLNFTKPYALRGGLFTYLSPLRRWNQSLRISLEATTQSNPLFDSQSLVSGGFSESVFPLAKDVASLSTRYTIPLVYPDDGGLLLPLYLSNIYLVAFTNTVTRYDQSDIIEASRGIVGGGIRFQFRISNLSLDIGVGYGYEISRNNHNFFIGDF